MTLPGCGRFAGFVAPHLPPHERVHGFGERLGQSVGQQLGHDGVVVVAPGAEFFAQLLQSDARRHGEAADPIAFRGDEIRQREVVLSAGLVAEHRQAVFAALGVCDPDVVALGTRPGRCLRRLAA